jgi:hypothetical protein
MIDRHGARRPPPQPKGGHQLFLPVRIGNSLCLGLVTLGTSAVWTFGEGHAGEICPKGAVEAQGFNPENRSERRALKGRQIGHTNNAAVESNRSTSQLRTLFTPLSAASKSKGGRQSGGY